VAQPLSADGAHLTAGASDILQVAQHSAGPLLVTGAAGSGRTSSLAARYVALNCPRRTLALAPTGGGAGRLERAIDAALGDKGREQPTVLTVTAAAAELLRAESAAAGSDPLAHVATRTDRLALLLDRLDELPLRHHDLGGRPAVLVGALIARIDEMKAGGVATGDVAAWAAGLPDGQQRTAREREFAAIMAAHDRLLEGHGLLDAGEVVLRATQLLERRDDVRERTGARWQHLLVDDLEDATTGQLRLIELLTAPHGNLVATIDDDPSIRAGSARLGSLTAHGIGGHRTTVIDLGDSRRCPPQITAAALGSAGRWKTGGSTEDTGAVKAWRCADSAAEAQAVADHVSDLLATGVPPEQIAVIVPSVRRDGQQIAAALQERAVPNHLTGAAALLGQAEVRDVLAWLRLLVDPSDASAAVRALTRPPFDLHAVDVARCLQIARRRKLDMVRGLSAATESPQLPPEARDRVVLFLRQYEKLATALDGERPELFVHHLIEDLGLRRRHVFAAQADVVERLRGLARLGELAQTYADRVPQATPRDFARWLASLADVGMPIDDDWIEQPRGVTVLELEAAKGHQWQHVVICGLSAGQIPGRMRGRPIPVPAELLGTIDTSDADDGDLSDQQTAEARRLLRIAMTRAAEQLVLSFAEESPGGTAGTASSIADEACAAAGIGWEPIVAAPGDADQALQAAFVELRDELLADVQRIGVRLGELRLDTDLDVAHGATRYLELLKVAALLARPEGQSVDEALPTVTGAVERAATSLQREILRTSTLDDLLTGAAQGAAARASDAAATARHEPSLEPFLPRKGEGLALSASDIESYRACPLKYKFARVLRIPQEPTINQRFGIVVHQVLERFHQDTDPSLPARPARPRSLEELLGLLETSWRRAGFGTQSDEEVQLWHKAESALRTYHARFHADDVEPVWFERSFKFLLGRHTLRGRVDRVDRLADGGYELIDYKTGRPKTAEQQAGDIQLTLYALAAERAWELPSSRQSYYYVLDDQKVPLPETSGDAAWISEVVEEVAAGIEAQGFEPTPSFSACSMCDYALACPARER
jgi:DNA helicase-2/ATP-dependent DNA helicase PcrA